MKLPTVPAPQVSIDIVNGSGEVVQHYVYSSFGTLKAVQDKNGLDISNSPAVEPYLTFTGRELDKESGNYYFRARNYDSHSGRFLQQDPVQGDITNPLTVTNKYIYSLNNPINRVDPTGEYSLKQVFGFALSLTMPFISMTTDLFDDAFDLTNGQINTLNTINLTAGLIAASIFTGGAAAAAGGAVVGALGITSTVGGAIVGGIVGAAVGGVIGGVTSVAAGGSFKSGFVAGAIMGAISGGAAGMNASSVYKKVYCFILH